MFYHSRHCAFVGRFECGSSRERYGPIVFSYAFGRFCLRYSGKLYAYPPHFILRGTLNSVGGKAFQLARSLRLLPSDRTRKHSGPFETYLFMKGTKWLGVRGADLGEMGGEFQDLVDCGELLVLPPG